MMAGIFLMMGLSMLAALAEKRALSLGLLVLGLIFMLLMFWHHLTTPLQINL